MQGRMAERFLQADVRDAAAPPDARVRVETRPHETASDDPRRAGRPTEPGGIDDQRSVHRARVDVPPGLQYRTAGCPFEVGATDFRWVKLTPDCLPADRNVVHHARDVRYRRDFRADAPLVVRLLDSEWEQPGAQAIPEFAEKLAALPLSCGW